MFYCFSALKAYTLTNFFYYYIILVKFTFYAIKSISFQYSAEVSNPQVSPRCPRVTEDYFYQRVVVVCVDLATTSILTATKNSTTITNQYTNFCIYTDLSYWSNNKIELRIIDYYLPITFHHLKTICKFLIAAAVASSSDFRLRVVHGCVVSK